MLNVIQVNLLHKIFRIYRYICTYWVFFLLPEYIEINIHLYDNFVKEKRAPDLRVFILYHTSLTLTSKLVGLIKNNK